MAAYWVNQNSYSIISDTKHHGIMEIFAFMHPILNDVKQFVRDLSFVSYWSDCTAQHLKNRFNISNLTNQILEYPQNGIIKSHIMEKDPITELVLPWNIIWNTILKIYTTVHSAKIASQTTFCAYVSVTEISAYEDTHKSRQN